MKKLFSFGMALLAALSLNAADYYLVGSCQNWSNGNEKYKFMEKEGVLTLEIAEFSGKFKIIEGKDWHPQFGGIKGTEEVPTPKLEFNKPYTLTKEASESEDPADITVDLADKHIYKDAVLTLDVTNTNAPVITLISGTDFDNSATPVYYYLVGAFQNWDPSAGVQFIESDGKFTANVPDLNGTFKVIYDKKWGTEYASNGAGLELNKPYELKLGGDNLSFSNPFAGYKNAVLTLDTATKVLTLVAGDFYVTQADWYMPGTKLGWNCDDNTKFTPVEGKENTYELLAAEFGGDFKVVYGQWAVEFGQDADSTKWEVNKEYNLQVKGGNVNAVDNNAVFTDATITIVVDYEAVSVKLTIDATPAAVENIEADKKASATKVIENGQLFIIKGGVRYNALGTVVVE